ncbi:MAG: HDIG domain-containing protein [Planctomycetia bacterium]|jgi:putative nucleotidyltransferase with HDIG domain
MPSAPRRTRSERVAAIDLPPGLFQRILERLTKREVLMRIGFAFVLAMVLCVLIHGWSPPFSYRAGYVPSSDIVASVPFQKLDPDATEEKREEARQQARLVYSQDSEPIKRLQATLNKLLLHLAGVKNLEEVQPDLWKQFTPPKSETTAKPSPPKEASAEQDTSKSDKDSSSKKPPKKTAKQIQQEQFAKFQAEISGDENMAQIEAAVKEVLRPYEKDGLLEKPPTGGNQEEIYVYPKDRPRDMEAVSMSKVLLGDGTAIRDELATKLGQADLASRLFAWLQPKLSAMNTLTLDKSRSLEESEKAAAKVDKVYVYYARGQVLAKADDKTDEPLGARELELLKLEHEAFLEHRSQWQRILRTLGMLVILMVLIAFCGYHLRLRDSQILKNPRSLIAVTIMVILTVAAAKWAARDPFHAEIVPVLIFGQIIVIAYKRELAIALTGFVTLVVLLGIGLGLGEMIILLGTAGTAIFQLNTIRNRSKLIVVGIASGLVASLLTLAVGLLDNQPMGLPLFYEVARNAGWPIAAGFLMTGLLPLIEKAFGVLTDISLLELGDVAHPLLQELVRRAPSTYNHSVTVGSIAEAAADAIGARGLLVRVGAYFHDIGKMLKPGYYIENQGDEQNRHDGLVPAMSSLVIIAHIKDGANLARQHRLPESIIDLIQQHHGTTLVGYFYQQASRMSEENPDAGKVDESSFRYPGPKPQTKEAAVLMLADAVESASRTLVGPTPARIESLVRELADRRLEDGQFDESGLTLRELRSIEESMVKSVTAIYHGRVKYPDQKTD